ncbi:glycosyltransferase family 9 protein [Deferribacteraceae bacterium V6Fe1]|nr:glycosyltransferase family 9 protein [Deferribacteraceae bacterium V6Fe1]
MMKILVFNPSFIGDCILTTPLLKYLKNKIPGCKIYFCVRPESAPLFKNLDFIDEVVVYDKRKKDKGLKGLIQFAIKLNSIGFDKVVSVHKSFRSSLVIRMIKANIKVGFNEATLPSVYTHRVCRDMSLHEIERNLMLASKIINGFDLEEAKSIAGKPQISIDETFFSKLHKYLDIAANGKKVVAFAPTSNWKTKMWPAEKYAFLVNKLYEKGVYSLVFAAKSEEDDYLRFKRFVKVPFFDFALKTSIAELSSAIKSSDLLVCNDSAPLHMGVAHNRKILCFFGPTVPAFGFYPYTDDAEIVEVKNLYCRPCHIHGKNSCPEKHFKCMNDIDENVVLEKILAKLGINETINC